MSILAGRYQLERRLGGGGMAEVFLGKLVGKDGFSRPVAIKRVLAHLAADEAFTKMFVTEAQICSKLQHPNIVSVLDFDRDDDGRPFLVIELVDGPSLAELDGALPIAAALHIATELLRGLAYAHDLPGGDDVRGIVHRDISPHNILLSWEGAVKLSDFGIAKARAASGVTASELVKGKPAYMSPEQANAESLDGRSDLFSVGIVLWELLVGRALFSGHTTQETLARVLFAPIPSPRSIRAEIPDDVDRVVMKLLARDLPDRYADASAAIADLVACKDFPRDGREKLVALLADRFAANAPQRTRMLGDVPTVRTPAEYAPTLPAPRDARDAARSRLRPTLLVLAGLTIASSAVAVVVTVLALGRRESRDPAPVAAIADAHSIDVAIADASISDSSPSDAIADATPIDAIGSDAAPDAPQSQITKPAIDRAALRAKLFADTNNSGRVRFAVPPGRIDAMRVVLLARQEAERLLGPVPMASLTWSAIEPDGSISFGPNQPGGVVMMFRLVTPLDDGSLCIQFDAQRDGGIDEMLVKNNPGYCDIAVPNTKPRCTALELRKRAIGLGMPTDASLTTQWRIDHWTLLSGDLNVSTPNDCH